MPRQILRQADAISETRSAPGTLRAGKLLCLALAVLMITSFYPYLPGALADAEQTRHVFRLQYKESGFWFHVRLDLESTEVVFKKEPDYAGREVVRSVLPIGQGRDDFIGFAWDRVGRRLYLDLNRNLDLTDDPSGAFESQNGLFEGIRLEYTDGEVSIPYVIDVAFYRPFGSFARIRSGWEGEIELNGKKMSLGIVDNMDGTVRSGPRVREPSGPGDIIAPRPFDSLILRARNGTDEPDTSEVLGDVELPPIGMPARLLDPDPFPIPQRLSFDGGSYDLAFAFEPGETQTELVATFTESDTPMGKLKIDGQFIKRLILWERVSRGLSLVVLDSPDTSVLVPVGEHFEQMVYLDSGGPRGLFRAQRYASVFITEDEPTTLTIGGPLKHDFRVYRRGNALQFAHTLRGTGGITYTASEPDLEEAPVFVIYKDGQEIASGAFEYG